MAWHSYPRGRSTRRCGSAALLAAGAVALASGCALRKPPDPAEVRTRAMPSVNVPAQWTGGVQMTDAVDNWLVTFRDDRLTEAVLEAIAFNSELREGAARVEQARLHARLAGADLYPSVDLLAKRGGKMSGDGSGLQGAVLTLRWELDLWGRVRYGRAAAVADAAAARADFEFSRQSIAALVAKNWFLATEAALQAEVARQGVRDSDELVRLAEARLQIGAGNAEDVYMARASTGTYRDALRQIDLSRAQAIRGLEVLLGRYPAGAADITPRLPGQPDAVPAGLPSELLERRPDVVAAERRVAAAFNRVHEAKAARLPAIAMTSGVSSISSSLFLLQDRSNPIWNLGVNLLAPIYKGGALKTQVDIRSAEQAEAIAAYASVGIRAFGDVEQALAAELAARERERILMETLADEQRALDLVVTRFKVGSTDLRFVTQQQLVLNATQAALIRMQAEQRIQRVNLHLAVGGSFDQRQQP